MAEILEDLLGFLTANLNQNRVFIPTLVTITKLFGEGEHFEWHRSAFSAQVQDMYVMRHFCGDGEADTPQDRANNTGRLSRNPTNEVDRADHRGHEVVSRFSACMTES